MERPRPVAAKRDQPPSVDRALAILSAFRGDNRPRRPSDLATDLDIPRSSTYQIIRTLLVDGYLEKVGRGRVRLGHKFVDLLIASRHQQGATRRQLAWSARRAAHVPNLHTPAARRDFLWNPHLTEMADCTRFRQPPPYRIGFSNASTSNPWRRAMLRGMLDHAQKHSSHISQFIVRDAQDDPCKQAADIEALLHDEVDLLLVSCSQAQPMNAVLARVAGAGVPVVAVDRRPSHENFLIYVSASDITLGRVTAQWMAERLHGQGTIFMLAGVQGSSPAERRLAAAMEVFSQYPSLNVAAVRYTDWREEIGRAVTTDLIRENDFPDGVWCDSGLQGAGAMQAFLDLGLDAPQIPPHTGGDVNHAFQLALRHRIPLAAVEYPAWMGTRALQAGLDVLAGKTMPRQIEVHSQVVISRGEETTSVHADVFAEDYVRWECAMDFVASHSLRDRFAPGGARLLHSF